jgi:hypothetical protein
VPRLRRSGFFLLCQHDARSKGKGRLIETRNWRREKSKDKLETRRQKLEIGKAKGVLSEGQAAARGGWDRLSIARGRFFT